VLSAALSAVLSAALSAVVGGVSPPTDARSELVGGRRRRSTK
jgi:hypothetical protein